MLYAWLGPNTAEMKRFLRRCPQQSQILELFGRDQKVSAGENVYLVCT